MDADNSGGLQTTASSITTWPQWVLPAWLLFSCFEHDMTSRNIGRDNIGAGQYSSNETGVAGFLKFARGGSRALFVISHTDDHRFSHTIPRAG